MAAAFTITLGMLLVVILDPDAATVYAANMFGALRAPGEPAFVAGHRGDRADAPENTMPAFEAGLASSLEFVELDVQLSADAVPVIIHDTTVDRTTNGAGAVAELTLAELQALDAGSWFGAEFTGIRIPTFEEFLATFTGSTKKALVELKGRWTTDQVAIVTDQIFRAGVQHRIVLMSFDFVTLFSMERVAPSIPRVIILRSLPPDPVEFARTFGVIAVLTTVRAVTEQPGVVDAMHRAGYGIFLYTLNKQSRWSTALALGVDGIVTDRPSRLDAWLAVTAPGT